MTKYSYDSALNTYFVLTLTCRQRLRLKRYVTFAGVGESSVYWCILCWWVLVIALIATALIVVIALVIVATALGVVISLAIASATASSATTTI